MTDTGGIQLERTKITKIVLTPSGDPTEINGVLTLDVIGSTDHFAELAAILGAPIVITLDLIQPRLIPNR